MCGPIPPVPNTPSWRGAQFKKKKKHRSNFTFTFYLPSLPLTLKASCYQLPSHSQFQLTTSVSVYNFYGGGGGEKKKGLSKLANKHCPTHPEQQPLCFYFHISFLRILYQWQQIQALNKVISSKLQGISLCGM
jgi:hypothetical protein